MTGDLEFARQLLRAAHETGAPDEIGPGIFEDREFITPSGWKVVIFYDGGELDYIDHFISPSGEHVDVWPDEPDPRLTFEGDYTFNPIQCWRGLVDTERLLSSLNERKGTE